jgi:hypothetical protein
LSANGLRALAEVKDIRRRPRSTLTAAHAAQVADALAHA